MGKRLKGRGRYAAVNMKLEVEGLWLPGAKKAVIAAVERWIWKAAAGSQVLPVSVQIVPKAAKSTLEIVGDANKKGETEESK